MTRIYCDYRRYYLDMLYSDLADPIHPILDIGELSIRLRNNVGTWLKDNGSDPVLHFSTEQQDYYLEFVNDSVATVFMLKFM